MKKLLLLSTILLLNLTCFAQKEVPILNKKPAFITQLFTPLTEIRVDIEDDFKGYFSKMEVFDSTMVFRTTSEYNSYISKYDKAVKDKANPKKKNVSMPDASLYMVKNRELLRPGLEIDIYFDEYRLSQRNMLRYLVIQTKLEGNDSFEGVYEGVTGNLAVIDGKSVELKPGAAIEGVEGFKGQKFQSFQNMMIGSFVSVNGKRQPNGILLVEKGKAWENKESPDDIKLKLALRSTMKLTSNEVSFGSMKFRLLKNDDLASYVSRVGRSVIPDYQKELPKGHPVKIDFNFYVVEDSTFNACAYPDGSVFVHTALLAQLENEAQLATILGHEVSHVTYEHARVQVRNQQHINTATSFAMFAVVAGVLPADVVILAAGLGGPALSSAYSRKLEEQADRAGLNYMFQAGYDPREAGKVWKRMYELTDVTVGHYGSNLLRAAEKGINSMYASHPDALKRYKNVNRLIALNYHNEDMGSLTVNKAEYRAKMKALRKWLQGTPYFEPDIEPRIKPEAKTDAGNKSKVKKPVTQKKNQKAALPKKLN
jgi:hypothetical protein